MNSTVGQILLWIGFLSGSLATVYSTGTFARLGLTVTDNQYVEVASVEDSKWENLALQVDDRLVKIGDAKITMDKLKEPLSGPAEINVLRAGEEVILKLDNKEATSLSESGVEFKNSNEVLFGSVPEDSEVWKAGVRPGALVVSIGETNPKTASEFNKALGGFSAGEVPVTWVQDSDEKTAQLKIAGKWASVNWLWYLLSALVGIAGIVVLNKSRKSGAAQSSKTEANLLEIKQHLANVVKNTQELNRNLKDFKPRQIVNFIEDKLADDLREFAEGRDSITAEHGLERFAKVMTQFASGERAINRAWSAAADGYVEEAATCVERGMSMMEAAQTLLNEN